MPHDIGEGREASVVHVGRGARDVTQRGHLELAEIAVLKLDMPGLCDGCAARIVVVAAKEVEGARRKAPDTAVPARVHAAVGVEERDADVVELAVRERRAEVADVAAAAADEKARAALRRRRITRRGPRVARRERVPEIVEGRAAGDERLQKSRERLADADKDRFVVCRRRRTERSLPATDVVRVVSDERRRARGTRAHFARIEDRADALRPERVAGAVPAEPALVAHVEEARGVALDLEPAEGARPPVLPVAERNVAGRAVHRRALREPHVEEEPLAERGGIGAARDPVRWIRLPGRRPRAVAEQRAALLGGEVEKLRGGACGREQRDGGRKRSLHSTSTRSVRRSPAAWNTNSQLPGM